MYCEVRFAFRNLPLFIYLFIHYDYHYYCDTCFGNPDPLYVIEVLVVFNIFIIEGYSLTVLVDFTWIYI